MCIIPVSHCCLSFILSSIVNVRVSLPVGRLASKGGGRVTAGVTWIPFSVVIIIREYARISGDSV